MGQDTNDDSLQSPLVSYLERIIRRQDDKIDRLIQSIAIINAQLRSREAIIAKMATWIDTLERIARRKNKRLEELGDAPSDIPITPILSR